jgi:membrane protease YdiL (CAAX protease family)
MTGSQADSKPTSNQGKLTGAIRKHPLLFYFIIAYAFSWIFFLPYLLSEWDLLPGNYTIFYIIHTFGPAVSAFAVTAVIAGKAGIRGLRQRIRQWRAPWQLYLFIFLGIPVLIMIGVTVQPGALASFGGVPARVLIGYPFFYLATFFGGGPLGEEPGWRGFALPRLQTRYGPLWGTLLLGLLWSCWHLPDFLTASKGGGPGTGWTSFLTNFPIFTLAIISLAVIMTWVYNRSQGSVLTATLAHTSVNTPESSGLVALFPGLTMISLNWGMLVAFGVLALLILLLSRGQLGYIPNQSQP